MCDRKADFAQWKLLDGSESYICPVKLVDVYIIDLIQTWYPHYKNGIFPVGGGLLDQSAYFINAMQSINYEMNMQNGT